MDEALRSKNLTPWVVIVYSGHDHWDKPIEELEAAFYTEEGSKVYAGAIRIAKPFYRVEIKKEE